MIDARTADDALELGFDRAREAPRRPTATPRSATRAQKRCSALGAVSSARSDLARAVERGDKPEVFVNIDRDDRSIEEGAERRRPSA